MVVSGGLSTSEKLASGNPTIRREGQQELGEESTSQQKETVSGARRVASSGFSGTASFREVFDETKDVTPGTAEQDTSSQPDAEPQRTGVLQSVTPDGFEVRTDTTSVSDFFSGGIKDNTPSKFTRTVREVETTAGELTQGGIFARARHLETGEERVSVEGEGKFVPLGTKVKATEVTLTPIEPLNKTFNVLGIKPTSTKLTGLNAAIEKAGNILSPFKEPATEAFKTVSLFRFAPTREQADLIGGKFKARFEALPQSLTETINVAQGFKTQAQIEKETKAKGSFIKGTVSDLLSFPRRHPVQTLLLPLTSEAFAAAEGLAILGAGKPLLRLAKLGLATPKVVRVASTVGRAGLTTAKVGIGAAFVGSKVTQLALAPSPEAKGRVFGSTIAEVGLIGAGSKLSVGGKRLTEIAQAKVSGPLNVASVPETATISNIVFAEDVGTLGLELSSRRFNTISAKSPIKFAQVEGATTKDVTTLKSFFDVTKRVESIRGPRTFITGTDFVKGSVAQESFLDPDLSNLFIESRGGKFPDIDAAIRDSLTRTPKTTVKIDVKESTEAVKILGARRQTLGPEGILRQGFPEQSFRKAVGGLEQFETGRPIINGKSQAFFRFEKDLTGVLFQAAQGQRELGLRPKAKKALTRIEDVFRTGGEDVTLPLDLTLKKLPTDFTIEPSKIMKELKVSKTKIAEVKPLRTRRSSSRSSSGSRVIRSVLSSAPRSSGSKSISKVLSSKPKSISRSLSKSPSISPSLSRSISRSISPSPSVSPSLSISKSLSPSLSPSASLSPSLSLSPSIRSSPKPPAFMFGLNQRRRKTRTTQLLSRKSIRTPSLVALAKGLTTTRKKAKGEIFTGLGIRRILK